MKNKAGIILILVVLFQLFEIKTIQAQDYIEIHSESYTYTSSLRWMYTNPNPATKKSAISYGISKGAILEIKITDKSKEGQLKLKETKAPFQVGSLNIPAPSRVYTDKDNKYVLTSLVDDAQKNVIVTVFKRVEEKPKEEVKTEPVKKSQPKPKNQIR